MKQRRLLATAIIAAAAVTWIAPVSSGGAQTDPAPSSAAITVTPDHDLVDGQAVQVDGAGFAPGVSILLMQCRPGSASITDVMANCELKTSHTTDATGAFSAFQTVEREILPQTASTEIDCGAAPGACTIAVLVGFSISSPVMEAPISFADATAPAPTVTVAPATELDDGDVVAVNGNGFPAGVEITVGQCQRNRPLTPEWCAEQPALTAAADATGAFTGQIRIGRGVTLGSGEVVDCVGEGCVVAAAPDDGSSWASTDISLVRRTILAAPFGPNTVTPQGTVDILGAVLCTPAGGELDVAGVITQTVDDRTITATFTTTGTCAFFSSWRAQVVGARTQRFKVGNARITAWANETTDPFPDDASAVTVDVQLVRPPEPTTSTRPASGPRSSPGTSSTRRTARRSPTPSRPGRRSRRRRLPPGRCRCILARARPARGISCAGSTFRPLGGGMSTETGKFRTVARWALGGTLVVAGTGHLTNQREEFRAQVPDWMPIDDDLVVLASGVVEIALGLALILLRRQRAAVGLVVAGFFVVIFPGNIAQYAEGTDAFGLDTDTKRLVRLFFQPVLVVWALWSTGATRWLPRRSVARTT